LDKQPVERSSVQETSGGHDGTNAADVGDVLERVPVQQHQVGISYSYGC